LTSNRIDDVRSSRKYIANDEGCTALAFILIIFGLVGMVFCGVVLGFIQLPFTSSKADVLAEQLAMWEHHNIQSYTVQVEFADHTRMIRAEGGHVVDADSNVEVSYTINWLFDRAAECNRFCSVEYDATYGFPAHIGGGFLGSVGITVIDFQPID